VDVWGIDGERWEIGHFSSLFRRDRRFARLPAGDDLLARLLEFGASQDLPPVLFVAGDPYLGWVCDNHEALREHFVLYPSYTPEGAKVLLHKTTFYARCRELEIGLPATFFPTTEEEAEDAARQVRYPAIVKPEMAHVVRRRLGGRKLVEVADRADCVTWWRRLQEWGSPSVIQEVIEGPEANIFVGAVYAGTDGRVRSLMTARKSRQYPPWYGSGSYMEACWQQEIADLSRDIVQRLGYRGICGTEFKWDARDGRWKLIEINPRPTLWFALARACGVDVIWDAYCDLVGRPNADHIGGQDDSVRWQFLVRDVVSGWKFFRDRDLSAREFLRTVVDPRKKEFAVLSRRDKGAIVGYPINTIWKYSAFIRRPTDG